MNITGKSLNVTALYLVSLWGASPQLLAANDTNNSSVKGKSVLEEVVVTANKRGAQALQDTAGNIQVISSDTLDRLSIEGLEDYIKLVPGLDTISSGAGQSDIVIRGINAGRVDESIREDTALAVVYVDDIPISMPGYTPDLSVLNTERIEVLRGPQGTLYGKSAMSGTIRVVTKQPDVESFFGKVKMSAATVKDGDPNYGLSGFVNVPLSEKLAFNLNAFSGYKGGFIDNVDPVVGKDDYNKEEKFGGRAQLAYYGDRLTVTGTLFYDNLDADGRPDEFKVDATDPRIANITDERQITRFYERDYFESDFIGGSIKFDWNIADVVTLTSATSYFESDIVTSLDDTFRLNGIPGLMQRFTGVDFQVTSSEYGIDWTTSTLIHETRLASTYESPLQWVVGVYYEDEERDFYEWQIANGLNAALGLPADSVVLGGPRGPNPANHFYQRWREVPTEHVAVFGEAAYRITENLELLIGLRWFENKRKNISDAQGYLTGTSYINYRVKEDDIIPKAQLTYHINDDVMVYASFAEGYRQGGTNSPVLPTCMADLAAIGKSDGEGYESDSLLNYEIGTKTSWLDGRFIMNATLYRIIWEDIQNPVALDCGSTPTYNAGEIEFTGIESEMIFQATDALALRLGIAYTQDAEVVEPVKGVNQSGDTPPYVRDIMISASVDYRFPIWSGEGFVRGDLRSVDAPNSAYSSTPGLSSLPSYNILDLTLGYQYANWNFSLEVRNLLDDRIVTNIDPDRRQPATFSLAHPRTIGFTLSRHF